jgi:hypothetical protein
VDVLHAPGPRAERLLRDLLRSAPLAMRAHLAPAVARARASVRALRGAGDERALDALLATCPPPPHASRAPDALLAWLEAVAGLAAAERADTGSAAAAADTGPPATAATTGSAAAAATGSAAAAADTDARLVPPPVRALLLLLP